MNKDPFSQSTYKCKLDWGRIGTRKAAERGDILIIVDTLSFSTAVITAVNNGAKIYPCSFAEDPKVLALQVGGEVAVGRKDVPTRGRFSLSPLTYLNIEPDSRIVLQSPNGATCIRYCKDVPYLFIGALVNAKAVAAAVSDILNGSNLSVTIIACGERWVDTEEEGEIRVAIEDYLGAGAILSYLQYGKSPEARVCEAAFLQVREDIEEILWESGSGRELREKGFDGDVKHAAQLNLYGSVPVMRNEYLERLK
jgi:2-phosphosulfolactate phosphatase